MSNPVRMIVYNLLSVVLFPVTLIGFVIWIGLFISWIFFHGVKPPLVGG